MKNANNYLFQIFMPDDHTMFENFSVDVFNHQLLLPWSLRRLLILSTLLADSGECRT